jgi:hypothetical protein
MTHINVVLQPNRFDQSVKEITLPVSEFKAKCLKLLKDATELSSRSMAERSLKSCH